MKDCASALRTIRLERGLTQTELARRAGVHAAHVSRWETGHQPVVWRRLARLADVLGVTCDALLGREPPPPAPVDALARQDRELLAAMRDDAEELLGAQVLRLAGGWRRIARFAWAGALHRIRQHGVPSPEHPPAPEEGETARRRYRRLTAQKACL